MFQYDKPDNLVELIETSVSKYSDRPLFGTKNKAGEYEWVTYREVGERIDNLRGGLAQIGLNRGDAVGLIADNRTEWAVAAFATYGIGGQFIPMYEKELLKIWKYIINDSGVKVLFVSKPEIYEQIRQFNNEMPCLEKIFLIEGEGENTMAELEKKGAAEPLASIRPKPEDVAVLIYTSGTTGNPKGVLLTHGNFTSNFIGGGKMYAEMLSEETRSLCILPWAHSYGQTAELYNFINFGGSMGFVESVETFASDMEKVQPTFLICVPRLFNKIYDGLWTKMNETGGLAKKLFEMGVESAKKRRELAARGESDFLTNIKYRLADAVVFKKIRQKMGGNLEAALTASATMNVEISNFFSDIGIPVFDCYGLTETSPAVTMNAPGNNRPGSVGRPIDKVKVVIDRQYGDENSDDGEIIVYGPNVMKGYQNNPEATKEVITEDGGFRTGDRGRVDEDGFLFITGRIKEQYKLENGKYVFPAALEEEIRLVPWVENAMIYGEGKPYNVCLIIPDFLVLEKYAREKGMSPDPQRLVEDAGVQQMISDEITAFLKGKFGSYEIPKKFIYIAENFSLDNGTLTQTMKLKRRSVMDLYGKRILDAYGK